MKNKILSVFVLCVTVSFAQNEIRGKILDENTKRPLSSITILLKKTSLGTISNQEGEFNIKPHNYSLKDTLIFQAIGYETKNIPVSFFKENARSVFLKKNITQLSIVFIENKSVDAKSIVKNILKFKHLNYKNPTKKEKVFFRKYFNQNFNNLEFNYKKGTIPELSRSRFKTMRENVSKKHANESSFFGDIYFTIKENKTAVKINPQKVVEYNDETLGEKEIYNSFAKLFSNTQEKEYWKVKSGIFGTKINIDDDGKISQKRTKNLRGGTFNLIKEKSFSNKDTWEFLHKTNRYHYEILETLIFNNEEVYKIKFTPKNRGHYVGLLFVTKKTNALVKANFEYAADKTTGKIKLFGVFKERNNFKGIIVFNKVNNHYELKYCSYQIEDNFSFDRKVALQQKKDRFLFDKTLREVKLKLNINVTQNIGFEYFVIEKEVVDLDTFDDFKEPETFFSENTGEYNLLEDPLIKETKVYKNFIAETF